MTIREALKKERLFFDGAMGSLLQAEGLPEGLLPAVLTVKEPEKVEAIHLAYLEAGSRILTANTFGISAENLGPYGLSVRQVMAAGVRLARQAIRCSGREAFTAADLGPTGQLLRPYGELDFEEAVSRFREAAEAAEEAGADLLLIETMSDLYEMKAAVLGAKEGSGLPIFATLTFDENGKLFTGGDPASAVALLEGLGVDALGANCGLGPALLLPVMEKFRAYSSTPLICRPNAGLPETRGGKAVYRLGAEAFAGEMKKIARYASVTGGCCGTNPAHIAAMTEKLRDIPAPRPEPKDFLLVSSGQRAVVIGQRPVLIGERLNPSGRTKLREALLAGDTGYVVREALRQEASGADILDVNVGLPDLDEPRTLTTAAETIQGVTALPLQLDTADPDAMEQALRRYNGKPLINSVNAGRESLAKILPLAAKYGGGLVCLPLDEDGIPGTAEGRVAKAKVILEACGKAGIPRRELLLDALAAPISAGRENAWLTLQTLEQMKQIPGVKTILGISNISFGLPERDTLNASFLTLALQKGLDAAIVNPNAPAVMSAYDAYLALSGRDPGCERYLARHGAAVPAKAPGGAERLSDLIAGGLKDEAVKAAERTLAEGLPPEALIDEELVPALGRVGEDFAKGLIFLPRLLLCAEAAGACFAVLRDRFPAVKAAAGESPVVLATVKGDTHDIGKNLVKILLESRGFNVLDLGKDVAPETIAAAVRESGAQVVALSALLTTAAPNMKRAVEALREDGSPCRIVVGGAVITKDYAASIGADYYAASAADTVRFAEQILRA